MADDLHRSGAENAEFPQRELTERIIGAAMEVHRELGPGLLESIYQRALAHELSSSGLSVQSEFQVPVAYKGMDLDASLRIDLLVNRCVIVEVKAIDAVEDIDRAQLLSYLRLTGLEAGLIVNFNVMLLKHGIRRVVNTRRSSASSAPLR